MRKFMNNFSFLKIAFILLIFWGRFGWNTSSSEKTVCCFNMYSPCWTGCSCLLESGQEGSALSDWLWGAEAPGTPAGTWGPRLSRLIHVLQDSWYSDWKSTLFFKQIASGHRSLWICEVALHIQNCFPSTGINLLFCQNVLSPLYHFFARVFLFLRYWTEVFLVQNLVL